MQELRILERGPGPHVIIDIEFVTQFPSGSSASASFLHLPQEIFIKNRKYILSCAIEYVPAPGNRILGSSRRYVQTLAKI